jgi:hypothetical protein
MLKLGSLVYISEDSEYRYQGYTHDGKRMVGTIIDERPSKDYAYRVQWPSGFSKESAPHPYADVYRREDLIPYFVEKTNSAFLSFATEV